MMDPQTQSSIFQAHQNFILQTSHVEGTTKIEQDLSCRKEIVELFLEFAKDYYHTQHYCKYQEQGLFRYEPSWNDFVKSFADEPVSVIFVRKLSDFFVAKTQAEIEETSNINKQETSSQQNDAAKFLEKKPIKVERNFHKTCEEPGCSTVLRPGFNYERNMEGRYCCKHKLDAMIKVRFRPGTFTRWPKRCEHHDCRKFSVWGWSGPEGFPRVCGEHKLEGMIEMGDSRVDSEGKRPRGRPGRAKKFACTAPGCDKPSRYDFPGSKEVRYCRLHKTAGMADLRRPPCEYPGCYKRPRHNFQGQKKGRFCQNHKVRGMVNVVNKQCEDPTCSNAAYHNFPPPPPREGEKPVPLSSLEGRYCSKHKLDGMVNLRMVTCAVQTCHRTPTYGFEGEKKPRFCSDHKVNGMINFKARTCRNETCKRPPCYGYTSENIAKFCELHRVGGMVQITTHLCETLNCGATATFNFRGEESKGRFCKRHKLPEMVNVRKVRKCEHPNCAIWPAYNYLGEKNGRFCNKHKMLTMVDVTTKKCEHPLCLKHPSFNYEGLTIRRFCAEHREPGMVCVRRKSHLSPSTGGVGGPSAGPPPGLQSAPQHHGQAAMPVGGGGSMPTGAAAAVAVAAAQAAGVDHLTSHSVATALALQQQQHGRALPNASGMLPQKRPLHSFAQEPPYIWAAVPEGQPHHHLQQPKEQPPHL